MSQDIPISSFTFNFKSIIIDEIALSGLEGIGLDFLWKRLEKRLSCSLTPKIKTMFWKFIVSTKCITFYNNKTPIPELDVLDRFSIVDEVSGHIKEPPDYIDGPYDYCPIENEYGSASNYKSRKVIHQEILEQKSFEEIFELYGNTLVMVASLEERWHALAPHKPLSLLFQLTPVHYCILELVGRGRENGQMTVGKSNLNKIVNESKLLFYNRKYLQDLDLIRTQCLTQVVALRGIKSLILRLKRFHEPMIKSQPKIGKIHDLITYLLNTPKNSEKIEIIIRKGLLTPHRSKRLQKTVNIFKFDKEAHKKKTISLFSQSDESSHSEEESEEQLQSQYKVGIGLLRQAYETFLDAGLKGLTQTEIAQLLGIEFYTARTICRILKTKNMVQEFLEDKGKQRTARFIAVAATNKVNFQYAQEKKELMDFLKKNKKRCISEKLKEVPEKKAKLDGGGEEEKDIDRKIIDIKVLDGLEGHSIETLDNSKKKPTLRQLKFATGILKVIKERRFVTGYQTLSSLVHKETGEMPMDTKALKLVIQKLLADGQLKVFKFKISYQDKVKYSLFICQPSVKKTDPFVKAYYDELCLKAKLNYKGPARKLSTVITRPLSNYTYPRYLKIQKLHEHIVKVVYFQNMKSYFSPGFTSLHEVIPEMTVELALGNISFIGEIENIGPIKINVLEQKILDATDSIRNYLLYSKHLHNAIRGNLKMLAVLGLIQCIKDPSLCLGDGSVHANFVFYVNRHAKILDTSGKWPRKNQNTAAIERSYHFKTMDDVYKYWNDVQTISLNTTITIEKRDRYRYIYPLCDETSVAELDDGRRYGDGLGACGFDSSFFMDIPRLWRTFCSRTIKPRIARVCKSQIKYVKGCKSGPKEEKKKGTKKIQKAIKPKKKSTRMPKPVAAEPPAKRPRSETVIKWTKLDDRILTMLKIAVTVMGQVPGCIKVRNTVGYALLSFSDPYKTASMCHRRSVLIEQYPELAHEKLCLLNELRRRRDLIGKYEGLMKVIKLRHYANLPKFIKECKIPMLELLWIIYQISKSKPYMHRTPCIASNLKEFNKNYVITASVAIKAHSLYRTPLASGPKLATLKEAVVLAIMLTMDETKFKEVADKIYKVFKEYTEKDLRGTIEELRKSGAISAREKIFNNFLNKVQIHEIVQSCYKISFAYRRRWANRMNSEFSDGIVNLINDELPQNGLKGSSDVNCFLFEMHACGRLDIVTVTIPIIMGSTGTIVQEEKMNIIDIESKYKLKSGLVGCKKVSQSKSTSEMYKSCNFEEKFLEYERNIVTMVNKLETQTEDKVIEYLESKEGGYIFSELKDLTKMDRKTLYQKLIELEKDNIIKRVGYYENRIVLIKHALPWLFEIGENQYILPTPWLDLYGKLQRNIFIEWSSVIINKIFECPGSSIEFLSNIFEYITYRGVQDVCQFLSECECINLKCLIKKDIDLFSDDDDDAPVFYDFHPYEAPNNIYAFPIKDSLTKFSYIKQQILKEK